MISVTHFASPGCLWTPLHGCGGSAG